MMDPNLDLEVDLTPEEREALLARADEFREIEAKFDSVMRDAERQLEKAENDADRAMKNGVTEAEAMNMYRDAGSAIKKDVHRKLAELEEMYKQKYAGPA